MFLAGLRQLKGLVGAAVLVAVAAFHLRCGATAIAQSEARSGKNARVQVKQDGIYFLSVHVDDTPLTGTCQRASQRLKAPYPQPSDGETASNSRL